MKQTPLSLSLSHTHKAPWSRRMEAGDMVAARFGRNRAVSAISARIGPVRHKPARISTQQKKKWHGCMSAASPHQCEPGAGAAAPALHLCFLVAPTTILHNKTFNLSWITTVSMLRKKRRWHQCLLKVSDINFDHLKSQTFLSEKSL